MRSSRPSFAETFQGRSNSLNLLRLFLAGMVLFSHDITIGGFGKEYIVGTATAGSIAVDGFFAISGFLIAGSVQHDGPARYLWKRALRIFPGFWVCLIFTALVCGPLAWSASGGRFTAYFAMPDGPVTYVTHNVSLLIGQSVIGNTPENPHYWGWNGSLWTLRWEFACYLGLGLVSYAGLLRRRRVLMAVWLAAWIDAGVVGGDTAFRFASIFGAGVVLSVCRDRIPDSGWIALGCGMAFVGGLWLPDPDLLAGPALGYLCIWLGVRLPLRMGSRHDLSYGIYLYAFPVGQVLAVWRVDRLGYVVYALLTVACVLPIAAGSWWLVESRALALKKWAPRWVLAKSSPRRVG